MYPRVFDSEKIYLAMRMNMISPKPVYIMRRIKLEIEVVRLFNPVIYVIQFTVRTFNSKSRSK